LLKKINFKDSTPKENKTGQAKNENLSIKIKPKLLSKHCKENLQKIFELQKNITLQYNNKTASILDKIKSLEKENDFIKQEIIPDIKPFIKTLNEMQIYTYNSLNAFKISLDSLQKNRKIFELGLGNELNYLKGRLHLIKDDSIAKQQKQAGSEDYFAEDDNFLEFGPSKVANESLTKNKKSS
jgi:hypothetical protein